MFSKSAIKLMEERKSVRTYLKKDIEMEKMVLIGEVIENLSNENMHFHIVDVDAKNINGMVTYGIIKGAGKFIVSECKKSYVEKFPEEFGFVFEKLILAMTDLELGTCWMGGTFQQKKLSKHLKIKEDWKIT